MPDEITSY